MNRKLLTEYLEAGAGKRKADLAIKGGTLINVDTGEYYPADIAIYKDKIVAVDQDISTYIGEQTQIIDAQGKYLAPGLIDCHLHVECSKMSMTRFAQAVLPHGTTSIVSGLDEYISVIGLPGLTEIFNEIDQLPFKVFWGLPYKTPYTIPKSTIAYEVTGHDHEKAQPDSRCTGVWELVREAVQTHDIDTLTAILAAHHNHKPIFGCSPLTTGTDLNEFLMSGVRVDHESYSHQEFLEKLRKGLHVVIRESAVTKFLQENIKAITQGARGAARHVSFCTDDVNAQSILKTGHLDHMVRLAIVAGITPMTAIQMATINGAEACQIDNQVGSIAPGKAADILLVDQPGSFNIQAVISQGHLVSKNGQEAFSYQLPARSKTIATTVHHQELQPEELMKTVTPAHGKATVRTIKSVGPFMRRQRDVELQIKDHVLQPDPKNDVAAVSVIERYGINGNLSHGFISGWSLQQGAIATTASPDDNNLVVAGVNYQDMTLAANTLIEQGGGQVVVANGKILAMLPLPIAGITTDLPLEKLANQEAQLMQAARQLGCQLPDPLFYLSFLPITAIPDLAITDGGCVDYPKLAYFDPVIDVKD